MALSIGANTSALDAAVAAAWVSRSLETSMERLSTGKRINSASDDAAGVAIASRLSAEITGTNQAICNAIDGQALIATAEGAHKEIETILQRMREIAVQGVSDTNNQIDRSNLQQEIESLCSEITRISSSSTWAGQNLIGNTGSNFSLHGGSGTSELDTVNLTLNFMSSYGLDVGGTTSFCWREASAKLASGRSFATSLRLRNVLI